MENGFQSYLIYVLILITISKSLLFSNNRSHLSTCQYTLQVLTMSSLRETELEYHAWNPQYRRPSLLFNMKLAFRG